MSSAHNPKFEAKVVELCRTIDSIEVFDTPDDFGRSTISHDLAQQLFALRTQVLQELNDLKRVAAVSGDSER